MERTDVIDIDALHATLTEAVDGEVRFIDGDRHLYSTDASNYRQIPLGVVVPRTRPWRGRSRSALGSALP